MVQKQKNVEALELAENILKNFELGEIPLAQIIMKAIRLARLVGDIDNMEWLKFELSGYPSNPTGVASHEWEIGTKSSRHYKEGSPSSKDIKEFMICRSVGEILSEIESNKIILQSQYNHDISSNTTFRAISPLVDRQSAKSDIVLWTGRLDKIQTSIYEYVVNTYYKLKFGDASETIFEKTRKNVDQKLADICPNAIQELVSAYENLESNNQVDLSNTANSCRRVLVELADKLSPANKSKANKMKFDDNAYVNRLMAYIEKKSDSKKYKMIVGSQLKYIGERIDSIVATSSKGVHNSLSQEEAERLVIYTYLLAGDILTLVDTKDLINKTIKTQVILKSIKKSEMTGEGN